MGKYVDSNLVKDEKVIYEATYHWTIWIFPILIAILLCWLVLPLLFPLYTLLKVKTDEMVITNKRLIIKTGVISRKTLELQLSKVETINVDQGIFGRLLGYGTIITRGTGGSNRVISMIKNPQEFRKAFLSVAD